MTDEEKEDMQKMSDAHDRINKRAAEKSVKRNPAEQKSDEEEKEKYRLGVRGLSPKDQNRVSEVGNALSDWESKFDRNRG